MRARQPAPRRNVIGSSGPKLLARVFHFDVTCCPACGGHMQEPAGLHHRRDHLAALDPQGPRRPRAPLPRSAHRPGTLPAAPARRCLSHPAPAPAPVCAHGSESNPQITPHTTPATAPPTANPSANPKAAVTPGTAIGNRSHSTIGDLPRPTYPPQTTNMAPLGYPF
jgi:hypothetical protein